MRNGYERMVFLDPMYIPPCQTLTVDSVIINWSAQNTEVKYTIKKGESLTTQVISNGYVTFDDLVAFFARESIVLAAVPRTGKCTIDNKSGGILGLGVSLAGLLGFTVYQIAYNTKVTSSNVVNVNSGLEYIKVHCSAVDDRANFSNVDGHAQSSSTLVTFPLPSGPIFGVTQYITEFGKGVPSREGYLTEMEFRITDQDDKQINVGIVAIHMSVGGCR